MFLHVSGVECLHDYVLRLSFSDGLVKEVDLQGELYGTVFEPLLEHDLFRQVRINDTHTTIEWPNGADFAPEFLYQIGKDVATSEGVRAA